MYAKPEETTEELIATYRPRIRGDQTIEELASTDGQHWSAVLCRAVVVLAVLLDTNRHAGHSDMCGN